MQLLTGAYWLEVEGRGETREAPRTALLLARHVVCLLYIFRLLFVHAGADNGTPGADNWYVPT